MLQVMIKKFFVKMTLVAMIVVTGCQTIELCPSVMDVDNCTPSFSVSTKVTPTHLDAYFNGYNGISNTRSVDISITPILNGIDTVMYLVNYPEGGWEVLSADLRMPKVLVQCDEGNITEKDLVANPSEEFLYNKLKSYTSYLHENPYVLVESGGDDWSDVSSLSIDPSLDGDDLPGIGWLHIGTETVYDTLVQNHLLSTRWGQGNDWNSKMPYTSAAKTERCVTGCVMVAAAQVLYYLHSKIGVPEKTFGDCIIDKFVPDTLDYILVFSRDVTFVSPSYQDYVWDMMPLYADQEGVSDLAYGAVSTLMLQLGVYMNARYYADRYTSCWTDRIPNAFSSHYDISCVGHDYRPDSLYNQIMVNKMPVIINMHAEETGGHSAVVDGMKEITQFTKYTYLRTGVSETIYKYEYEEGQKSYLMTINWGWDGVYDNRWYNPYVIYWGSMDLYTSSSDMVYGFEAI